MKQRRLMVIPHQKNDFLYDLYSKQGKSYVYTEGFPKFFYLLFGYAYTKINETAKNFM